MSTNSAEVDFRDRLTKIEKDAHAIGINMSVICRGVGISRVTPERWKKKAPKTIQIIGEMEKFVADFTNKVYS